MRSVSSSLPSQVPPRQPSGFHTLRRPLPEASERTIAPSTTLSSPSSRAASQAAAHAGKATDSATFSQDGQSLLNQPEVQQKKVLNLLDQMFGITNVASMSLKIDVSHAHSLQTSSREQQQSNASGLTYDYQDSSQEADYTAMNAAGTITLDDGRTFNLDLHYERAVIVTSHRSFSLSTDTPTSDAANLVDLTGTGKRLLDRLFPPAVIAKNLAEALRQFTQAVRPASSSSGSVAATDTPPSLIASLEVSTMSTQSLNAVFSHLRDLRQQRLADIYHSPIAADPQLDVVS